MYDIAKHILAIWNVFLNYFINKLWRFIKVTNKLIKYNHTTITVVIYQHFFMAWLSYFIFLLPIIFNFQNDISIKNRIWDLDQK